MPAADPPPDLKAPNLKAPDLEEEVDARLAELDAVSPGARQAGEALLAAAVALHTAALARLVDRLGDEAAAVARDPLVGPILELHDLLPRGCGQPAAPAPRPVGPPTSTPVAMPTLRVAPPADAPKDTQKAVPADRCELCGTGLASEHGHGVDVEQHRLVCLCDPCRIVLGANHDGHGRFRALPTRVIADPDFARADGEWEALGIPVSTAFFFHDSVAGGIVAFYPSPAGATESLLGAQQWEELAGQSTVATDLVPDTEAMLVRRTVEAHESYLVPVDRCYELVGLLRMHWRGFDGGQEAHDALDEFFLRIRADARDAVADVVVRA